MTKEDVKQTIISIKTNSSYKRVSENHPLELYLGLNESGEPTLRYNGDFAPIKIVGTKYIDIKQIKTSHYYSILFSFKGNEHKGIFYSLCEDIINATEDYCGSNGYVEIVNRFNQRKKILSSNSLQLSENEILGLIGELLFLKEYALNKYSEEKAIKGWSGPEPTHKDFSFENTWYEIKTISSSKSTLKISSIEQLDSTRDGHLVLFTLEKMSPKYNGISLNKLIMDIYNFLQFDNNKDLFTEKLKNVGYSYSETYDNYVYENTNVTFYNVTSNFPCLRINDIPKEIVNVEYELSIPSLENFKEN